MAFKTFVNSENGIFHFVNSCRYFHLVGIENIFQNTMANITVVNLLLALRCCVFVLKKCFNCSSPPTC